MTFLVFCLRFCLQADFLFRSVNIVYYLKIWSDGVPNRHWICQFRENIRNKLTHLMLWKTAIHTSLRQSFGTGMNAYSYFFFVSLCPWPCGSFMQSLQRFRLRIFGGILFGKSLPSLLSTRFPTTRDILFCMLLLSPLTDLWFTYGTTRDFSNSHPKSTESIFRWFSLLFMEQTVEAFIRLVSRT